jgi:hypothetical protein
MKRLAVLAFTLALAVPVVAGGEEPPALPPIRDNSFLLEEAYNQEPGVIQHISAFQRNWQEGDWSYSFTEEWPAGGQRHQVSLTLPFLSLTGDSASRRGIGDVALNYRFQALGLNGGPVAFAPRLSLLAPTGKVASGHGSGAWGVQVNLPLSVELGRAVVSHWNLGATLWPSAENEAGERADVATTAVGGSLVWLAHPRLNLMIEGLWTRHEVVTGPDRVAHGSDTFVSPGLRWRHNFASGLEIVPGIAFPIGLGSGAGNAVFLYVSFEHPLGGGGR